MAAVVQTPPRTPMEVFKMLPEGTRAELIDNVLYMAPSPFFNHQLVSADLFTQIYQFLKQKGLGVAVSAPMDVFLDEEHNAVQPDIIIVLKEQAGIIQEKGHIHGVPAMLIEILSEGNKSHDLIRKRDLYERFGVQEYHIVDPATKLVLSFSLAAGRYGAAVEEIGTLRSQLLQQAFTF